MKIVVLAGGNSPERDVSLSSGSMICNALASKGHAVVLVDAFLGIATPEKGLESLFKQYPDYQKINFPIPSTPPNLKKIIAERTPDTGMFFGQNVLEICRLADGVFIGLHGAAGENGQIQAVFDLLNIRYTGTNFDGCVVAMDKQIAKQILIANGQPTPPSIYLPNVNEVNWTEIETLGYPVVVKPVRGGSSIGVSIAHSRDELKNSLQCARNASEEDEFDILIEKCIVGREFCVGILDGKPLPPIEIIPNQGWFDYEKKYQAGMTREVCPADITTIEAERLQAVAHHAHQLLRLGFYSRIDLMLTAEGNVYCLEANTLPGMTPASLFPQEAAAAEIDYAALCEQIILNAIA